MAAKIKIADFRKEYEGLDWSRQWNQGGVTCENIRCDLAKQLAPRIQRIREMLPLIPDRFANDIKEALESIRRAEAAILRNQLAKAVLFRILGSTEIPDGIYPQADRVDVRGIWGFVESFAPSDVSAMSKNLQRSPIFAPDSKFIAGWILPDPDAKESNCIPFPKK